MARKKQADARAIIAEELERTGWDTASTFTVGDGARPGTETLAWWHQNTPENEQADTKRSVAYLRAYLRIGGERLHAGGLFLDRRRLWMDRSVISRLERDGYLRFMGEGAREPYVPKIDLQSCPERTGTLYPEPYRATVRERRVRQVGAATGLTDYGANVVTLPPGVWSSQRHWHDEDDELMVMLDGELVLVEDDGRTTMRRGDIAAWPKGTTNGHHLINESEAEASFLVIGANKGGGGYSGIDMIFRARESFYRHADGTPYRQYDRQE